MPRAIVGAILIAALAGCAGVEREEQIASGNADATPPLEAAEADAAACGADKLGRWLNVLPTDEVKADIAMTVGERRIRYYAQGDPITMDFSPARLNVELGADGRIKLFRCG